MLNELNKFIVLNFSFLPFRKQQINIKFYFIFPSHLVRSLALVFANDECEYLFFIYHDNLRER